MQIQLNDDSSSIVNIFTDKELHGVCSLAYSNFSTK